VWWGVPASKNRRHRDGDPRTRALISESGEDDCWNAERVGHHDELKAVVLLQANIGDQQVRRQRAQKRDGLPEAADSGAFEAGICEKLGETVPSCQVIINDQCPLHRFLTI
jgi:hypothetical protein